MSRKPVSRKRRFAILSRDGFACRYCGARASPEVALQVDHVLAVALGGSNDDGNLATACKDCNLGKGTELLPIPLELAPTLAGVRPEWVAMVGSVISGEQHIIRRKLNTIKQFICCLGVEETVQAADMARGKYGQTDRAFRYFVGICQRWISQRKTVAA